jgi:transcriptional regulator GlxA family with amidase domain
MNPDPGARWVVSSDRKVWTASGVSAGTDGFLAFLAEVYGSDDDGKVFADVASAHMEYSRVKDSTDDPWAQVNGVADVPRTG